MFIYNVFIAACTLLVLILSALLVGVTIQFFVENFEIWRDDDDRGDDDDRL